MIGIYICVPFLTKIKCSLGEPQPVTLLVLLYDPLRTGD